MRSAVVFEAERRGYGIDQIADQAMTVGDLIDLLQEFDEDDLFVLSHDNGYTYGSVNRWMVYEAREDEDGEWEREDY